MGSTYVIAEAGVNHNGSLDMAVQLIEAAATAGADAVKFQTFRAADLVTKSAKKAQYQQETDGAGTQFEMLERLQLDKAAHKTLLEIAQQNHIEFLSTPFDVQSLHFLVEEVGVKRIKVSSGDITNGPLLLAMAQHRLPIILSTGLSTLGEVEDALAVLAYGLSGGGSSPSRAAFKAAYCSEAGQAALQQYVTLLHCTTEYPTPFDEVNLHVMGTLQRAFGLPVGFSDHTTGIAVPTAATALGAAVIEKHFTLDRDLPGPDHKASLIPAELTEMVTAIRQVEQATGRSVKYPTAAESKNIAAGRRSLVALKPIRQGEAFTEENLTVKRPGDGVSPMEYWDSLGRVSPRDVLPDEQVKL